MTIAGVVVPLLVLAGLACWWLLHGRLTRKLLAEKHLREVAEALEPVKQAACRLLLATPADFAPLPRDPRLLASSAGLLVFYTVSRDNSCYCHHLSLSVVGGHTPPRAGETLILFLAGLLGVPRDRLQRTVFPSMVHEVQFVLDEREHAALLGRPITFPPDSLPGRPDRSRHAPGAPPAAPRS